MDATYTVHSVSTKIAIYVDIVSILSPFGIWNRGRKRSAWTKSNGDCAVAACWWHHGRPDLVFSHINRYLSPQTAGRAR